MNTSDCPGKILSTRIPFFFFFPSCGSDMPPFFSRFISGYELGKGRGNHDATEATKKKEKGNNLKRIQSPFLSPCRFPLSIARHSFKKRENTWQTPSQEFFRQGSREVLNNNRGLRVWCQTCDSIFLWDLVPHKKPSALLYSTAITVVHRQTDIISANQRVLTLGIKRTRMKERILSSWRASGNSSSKDVSMTNAKVRAPTDHLLCLSSHFFFLLL